MTIIIAILLVIKLSFTQLQYDGYCDDCYSDVIELCHYCDREVEYCKREEDDLSLGTFLTLLFLQQELEQAKINTRTCSSSDYIGKTYEKCEEYIHTPSTSIHIQDQELFGHILKYCNEYTDEEGHLDFIERSELTSLLSKLMTMHRVHQKLRID